VTGVQTCALPIFPLGHGEAMAGANPGVVLHVVPGMGHVMTSCGGLSLAVWAGGAVECGVGLVGGVPGGVDGQGEDGCMEGGQAVGGGCRGRLRVGWNRCGVVQSDDSQDATNAAALPAAISLISDRRAR